MNSEMVMIEDAVKLHHAGEIPHAVEKYQLFLNEHPDYTPVMHLLGVAYHQQHKYKLAEEMLSDIHQREPENTEFMIDLARVYSSQDEFDKSISMLEQAVEIEPDNPEYHYRLADVCEKNQNFDGAIQHYLDVIDLKVENSEIYESLARSFEKNNNPEAAELAYSNARLLSNDNQAPVNDIEKPVEIEANAPLVTVIIPTRSRIQYLLRALNSVKSQSYENWEVIVVNDDGEKLDSVINQYTDDIRFKFLQHPFRMGPGAARNTALRVAQGEIVCYLDDDDIYLNHHISDLVSAIGKEDIDVACTLGDVVLEDAQTNEVLERRSPFDDIDVSLEGMHVTNSIDIVSCAHKIACVEEVGYFDEKLTSYEDWDFILRLISKYNWQRLDSKTFEKKRRNSADGCVTDDNQADHIDNYRIIYERYPVDDESILRARKETVEYLQKSLSHVQSMENESTETVTSDRPINDDISIEKQLEYLQQGDVIGFNNQQSLHGAYKESLLNLSIPVKLIIEHYDVGDALAKYMDFLQLHPDYKEGHVQLGLLLQHGQQYQAAELAFDSASAYDQEYVEAYFLKAQALKSQNRNDEAFTLLSSINIKPGTDNYTLYRITQLYSQLADSKIAIDFVLALVGSTGVKHSGIYNLLGNLYYRDENLPLARQYYAEAITLNPEDNDTKINLKLVELLLGGSSLPLFLALPKGEGFGWGVCASYLRKELANITDVFSLEYENWEENGNKYIPGTVFSSIGAEDLNAVYPVRGNKNIGYTFFERSLTPNAVENAKHYDLVLAGSSWAVEKLKEAGINNVDLLIQGIDPNIFYPVTESKPNEGYFIFSGGKFEIRKSQDLVLKAVQALQEKYPDIILVNAWVNFWPNSMATMNLSPYIDYDIGHNEDWQSQMQYLYENNGINPDKIITCDITSIDQLRELYSRTDLGIFPNRSEGGTNLVLMEYMACAKPIIATNTTGHSDMVHHENTLVLEEYNEKNFYTDQGELFATWQEPSLDELIEKIEYAYLNKSDMKTLGHQGGEFMKNFTWKKTAESLIDTLHKWSFL